MKPPRQAVAGAETVAEPAHHRLFKQNTPGSQQLFADAQRVTPGGVSHFPRYHPPHPTFAARASGSRIWDVDGNEYIDLFMSHYDAILGHSPPPVVAALREILEDGLHVGLPTEHEYKLATLVTEIIPCAEQVRFCCSGSEANMYAARLARGFTGRNVVIKMKGGFHGLNTDLAVDVFSPDYTGADGMGLLPELDRYTISTVYNNIDSTWSAIRQAGDDLAAIFLEPVMGAGGFLSAEPEYLAFLREETRKLGALLIFDEVVTGFRVSLGGAQEYYGVTPDLAALGKVMGGTLPIGAIAGRADILELSSVLRKVPQAEKIYIGGGTYSCNPLSMVAGYTTLKILQERKEEIYPTIRSRNDRLCAGVRRSFAAVDIPVTVNQVESLMAIHFLKEKGLAIRSPVDLIENTYRNKQLELADRLRNYGVYMLHSGVISFEHSEADIDTLIAAIDTCAREMAGER